MTKLYDHFYWCSKCGKWITHETALIDNRRALRCPICNSLLRLKPKYYGRYPSRRQKKNE